MGKREVRKLLEAATESRGFSKRGDAFFRILGDGVLQVLKFEYEPCFTHYSLNVGLFSMYSELRESWFTSSGCIPRYCVMNFVGKQNAINVKNRRKEYLYIQRDLSGSANSDIGRIGISGSGQYTRSSAVGTADCATGYSQWGNSSME